MIVKGILKKPKQGSGSKNVRSDTLKTIGIFSMLLDHIGFIFFPNVLTFRILGRLALPIFASGIACGYRYTSNFNRYLFRLLIVAVIAQIPFMILFGVRDLNIIFTLAVSLVIIYLLDRRKNVLLFGAIILSVLIPLEYSLYGIAMAVMFYLFWENKALLVISQLTLTVAYGVIFDKPAYQLFAIVGVLIVLYLPVEKIRVRLPRYFFYVFYPAHLALLIIIKYLIERP